MRSQIRILYISSTPEDGTPEIGPLMLENEITQLQQASEDGTTRASFTFLPKLSVEDLALTLTRTRVDVLHISAHGDSEALELSNREGERVRLTARLLGAMLRPDSLPRLIYLNACSSSVLARKLLNFVPMAIGTTAPITNRAALASAAVFYQRLLAGLTVADAFGASQAVATALDGTSLSTKLSFRSEIDPTQERLHHAPRTHQVVQARISEQRLGERIKIILKHAVMPNLPLACGDPTRRAFRITGKFFGYLAC